MKIVVTGAGGLLGSSLVAEAGQRGYGVLALDRSKLDVMDEAAVGTTLREASPDVVVNCAAYTAVDLAESEPHLAMAVNRDGARHIASAAAAVGAVPVYVSTDYVFDGEKRTPYLPEDPTGPLSVYGRTKLEGELSTMAAAPDHVVVRTSWLYGRGTGFVPAILRRARAGEPLRVVDDQEGRPTWAPRAAETILDLVERDARGVWHAAGGGSCTWLGLAEEALSLAGIDQPIEPITSEVLGAAARRPSYSVMDLTATERLLGHEMTHWRDDLSRCLENMDG